ncbi:amino acid ABC transporter permease [Lentibacillus salicampi]|uniref:Amino acid ABC transporter permease n=1 Tax=Lentibacillus salicampi TaxID=175306 RepID=A0A4Y9ACL0_9BACI|nr:amino acid ABC transporter permease [Lentibacillus salicampi]TFJ92111.1 amino acid ABC transporter permease [Lentibacillus salicampi]
MEIFKDYIQNFLPSLLAGAGITIQLTIIAFTIALFVGLLAAFGRLSSNKIMSNFFGFYISALRGTPFFVQLMFIYFGLPDIGIELTAFQAAIIGLALNKSAYLAEIYRAGIQAIPKGQIEAGKAIGMKYSGIMRRIILPQAIKNELPSIGNMAILCLKNSSIAAVITVGEIMYQGQILASTTFRHLEVFTIVAVIYWILHYPLKLAVDYFEGKGNKSSVKDATY